MHERAALSRAFAIGLLAGLAVSGGAGPGSGPGIHVALPTGPATATCTAHPAASVAACPRMPGAIPAGTSSLNGTWTDVSTISASAPFGRSSAPIAYDPALREVVMFGGYNASGSSADADTWIYRSANWTDITTNLSTAPSARWGESLAYDPQLGGIVLFGGRDGSTLYNDTWLFNSTGWWDISKPGAPTPRMMMMLDFDPIDHYMIGFGGYAPSSGLNPLNDTWNLTASGWAQIVPTGNRAPPDRQYGQATWDASDSAFLVFGAATSCSSSTYTWSYVGGTWTNRTPSSGPTPPFPSGTFSLQYDPVEHRAILFGGDYPAAGGCGTPAAETWSYHAGVWTNLTSVVPSAPIARCCAGFAYDGDMDGMLLFGGNANLGSRQNDTWFLGDLRFAHVAASPAATDVGMPLNLTAHLSGPLLALTWNWTFGDGTAMTNASANISHAFLAPGSYVVEAVGSAADGRSWGATVPVRIYPLPTANPVVGPTLGDAPLTVGFRANVTGGMPVLSIRWNFSDAYSTTSATGSHVLPAGNFSLYLNVTDGAGSTVRANWTIRVFPSPEATPVLSPLQGIAPLDVNGTANPTGGDPPLSSTWDFSDGAAVPGTNASHTYQRAGTYDATYTLSDALGVARTWHFNVQVFNPIQGWLNASDEGVAPFAASLSGAAAGGAGLYDYSWSFSDGSANASGPTVTHTFSAPGNYSVGLEVVDRLGYRSPLVTKDIRVVAPLAASLTASSVLGAAPLTVNLTANSTGGLAPLSFEWSFGDGTAAGGSPTESHEYTAASAYVAIVTVTDALGEVKLASVHIEVVAPLQASLSVRPSEVPLGSSATLVVTVRNGQSPYEYRWGGLPHGCASSDGPSVVCTSAVPGSFAPWVLVTDSLGEIRNVSAALLVDAATGTPAAPSVAGGALSLGTAALIAGLVVAAAVIAGVVLWRRSRRSGGREHAPEGSPDSGEVGTYEPDPFNAPPEESAELGPP